jgi:acyl carrier protein
MSALRRSGLTSANGVSDRQSIGRAALAALASMATVDGPIAPDALLADIEVDSLDLVELAQILEEEHGLSVSASAFAEVVRVSDVIEVVGGQFA